MPISPDLLEAMTPAELTAYKRLLSHEVAMQSPLDLECLLFPETRRWPQLELINEHLVALAEYRLTADGPVPKENVRWWYRRKGSDRNSYCESPHGVPDQEHIDAFGAYEKGTRKPIVFQLAVSMMPRGGKSRIITEVFPLWLLLQDPDIQIGLGTYNDTFAGDWGESMKNVCMAHHAACAELGETPFLPFPEGGQRAARDIFKVQGSKGKIRYTGTGGAVTGKTLHVLIGDDFVKGEEDMLSDATRVQIHRFIDSTWTTRKTRNMVPGCFLPIAIELRMATRWHQMDPIGYSCYNPETHEKNPDWCIVNIPALAVEGPDKDPLGREVGEAHPNAAGLTKAGLEKLRSEDPRTFNALYQGNPAIEGGGLISSDFKFYWIKDSPDGPVFFWRGEPDQPGAVPPLLHVPYSEMIKFAAADMAATKKTASDYTVLGTFAHSREFDTTFCTSLYRKRITTDQYLEELVPLIEDNHCASTIVENVTYGQMFGQQLERAGQQVEFANAVSDKVARIVASGISSRIRRGKMRVLTGEGFLPELITEVEIFPYGDHDDQADMLAFASDFVNDIPEHYIKKARPPALTVMQQIEAQIDKQAKAAKGRGRGRDMWSRIR